MECPACHRPRCLSWNALLVIHLDACHTPRWNAKPPCLFVRAAKCFTHLQVHWHSHHQVLDATHFMHCTQLHVPTQHTSCTVCNFTDPRNTLHALYATSRTHTMHFMQFHASLRNVLHVFHAHTLHSGTLMYVMQCTKRLHIHMRHVHCMQISHGIFHAHHVPPHIVLHVFHAHTSRTGTLRTRAAPIGLPETTPLKH